MNQSDIVQRLLWEPAKSAALKSGLQPDLWDVARLDLSSRGVLRLNDNFDVVGDDGEAINLDHFFAETYRAERSRYYAPKRQPGAGDGSAAFTISRADAKDTRKYRAAKAQAEQSGQSLQIVD